MVAQTNEDRVLPARSRRALRTASAVALAAPLALAGVAAAADTRSGPGHAPPTSDHDHRDEFGGIDGAAMQHRIRHEGTSAEEPGPRSTEQVPRVPEAGAGGTVADGGASAQRLPARHGTRGWDLQVDGALSTKTLTPTDVAPNAEDDGAIPLARALDLGRDRGIATTGVVGDGPHGSGGTGTGDYDFYRVDAAKGETLTVDLSPDGELVPYALLYDAEGNLVEGAQDMTGEGAVHLAHRVADRGAYYVAVGGYLPGDPFDPASGAAVITEGPYELDVTLHGRRSADTDVYAVPLRRGDVLGATVSGSARQVAIHELDGDLVQSSAADSGVIYPDDSPLARGGNATANHVVPRTGLYLLAVSDGAGEYSLDVGAHRAPSTRGERPQTVLLDFSGPSFDNRVFGANATEPGIRDVSPLRDFLPRWGLQESDERAVVEATTEHVRQMLRHEIPGSRVRVTNDLEHPDLFGDPGVSRVIVGGTVAEAGLFPALGLSESVDPGNFAREETAIVMPGPMSRDDSPIALNPFLTDDSDRVRAVSQALGNVTAHEAGHFLGSFHTDDHDEHTSVMNTGNRLQFFAAGPDDVAGTADDDHIAMRTARYDPVQGFSGVEDTSWRTGVALR